MCKVTKIDENLEFENLYIISGSQGNDTKLLLSLRYYKRKNYEGGDWGCKLLNEMGDLTY